MLVQHVLRSSSDTPFSGVRSFCLPGIHSISFWIALAAVSFLSFFFFFFLSKVRERELERLSLCFSKRAYFRAFLRYCRERSRADDCLSILWILGPLTSFLWFPCSCPQLGAFEGIFDFYWLFAELRLLFLFRKGWVPFGGEYLLVSELQLIAPSTLSFFPTHSSFLLIPQPCCAWCSFH